MTEKATHYFLGGNTGQGFYSHFNYIIPQQKATRIICLKGGPGTGKSSLMKKIGKAYLDKGFDVEFHHCSSDSDSLDGVLIKNLNVALLDGTAPHMIDPVNPGAVDDIVNMGVCLKEENFKSIKAELLKVNGEIGNTFKRAYRFFAAAKAIYEDWYTFNNNALDTYRVNLLKEKLKTTILPDALNVPGEARHLFATAFTPKGIVTYIPTIIKDFSKVYVLKGGPGTGKTSILQYVADEAVKRGFNVEILHTPLWPQNIEHLIIPELSTAIVTNNAINKMSFEEEGIVYDMEDFLDKDALGYNLSAMMDVRAIFYILLQKGLDCIKTAKSLHDDLEKFYVPNMDFSRADAIYEEVLKKLEGYEKDLTV